MDEILFRGKSVEDDEWRFGYHLKRPSFSDSYPRSYIYEPPELAHELGQWEAVVPETVGQFTGMTDKNGKKIFEGDILTIQNGSPFEMTGQIIFEDGCFQLRDPACDMYECLWYKAEEMEVIGNIHNNDLEGLHGN